MWLQTNDMVIWLHMTASEFIWRVWWWEIWIRSNCRRGGLYVLALTRPWVTCCRYIFHLLWCRLPGRRKPVYRRNKKRETKNKTITLHTQLYKPVCSTTNWYCSIVIYQWNRRTRKLHLHWYALKCLPMRFMLGRDPIKELSREWRNNGMNQTSKLLPCVRYLHPWMVNLYSHGRSGCSQWNS